MIKETKDSCKLRVHYIKIKQFTTESELFREGNYYSKLERERRDNWGQKLETLD